MNTTQNISETEAVLRSMFQENTGASFLDSGSAYGRNWQRMQNANFDKMQHSIEFHKWNADNEDIELEATINTFRYCVDQLDYAKEWDVMFQQFCNLEENAELNHLALPDAFLEYLGNCEEEYEIAGIYGENEPFTVNTYNEETDLDQVLQYVGFTIDGEDLVILSVHGGCDVRGGYTMPRIFSPSQGLDEFIGHGRFSASVGCSEGHSWYKEDYNNWMPNDDEISKTLENTLFGEEKVVYQVANLEDYNAVDLDFNEETKTAHCPACMLLDSEVRNPLS